MPGNYGFDPLGLGTLETLVPFREAELKHARLAMLAAVGWPLQEIFHTFLADSLRSSAIGRVFIVDNVLETSNGMSPSLINGGLVSWDTAPALALTIYIGSVLELQDIKDRKEAGLKFNEYPVTRTPGDLSFDPLNVARGLPADQQFGFQEKELLNGRLAMLAITCYVLEEFVFGVPVVRYTPDLFEPLIFAPDFRAFMDAAFGMASMDGSIDGIAY